MLVTDGMLERVVLPHLLNLPTTREEIQNPDRRKTNVYLSATEFFKNPYCIITISMGSFFIRSRTGSCIWIACTGVMKVCMMQRQRTGSAKR